jgi:hypothetical protein
MSEEFGVKRDKSSLWFGGDDTKANAINLNIVI